MIKDIQTASFFAKDGLNDNSSFRWCFCPGDEGGPGDAEAGSGGYGGVADDAIGSGVDQSLSVDEARFDPTAFTAMQQAAPTTAQDFVDLYGIPDTTFDLENYFEYSFPTDPNTPIGPVTVDAKDYQGVLEGIVDLTSFLGQGLANLSPLGFALSALGVTDTSEIGKSFGEYTGIRGKEQESLVSNVLDYMKDEDKQVGPQVGPEAFQDPSPSQETNTGLRGEITEDFLESEMVESQPLSQAAPEISIQQVEAPASTPSLSDVYDYGFPDSGGVPLAPPIPSVPTLAPQPAAEVVTPEPRVRTASENTRRLLEGIYGEKITADLLKDRTDLSRIV
jgi:hypothetical protein